MEIFRSTDGLVSKFIHDNGDETAIKCVPSQSTVLDRAAGTVRVVETDRQKGSLFISSSVGCYMKCRFCHLTTKDSVFRRLSTD